MEQSVVSEPIRIEIPPLYCPFPYAIHPGHQELERRCLSWLGEVGVSDGEQARALLAAGNWAEGLACSFPAGTDEAMQLVVDWAVFYAVLDDLYTDLGPVGRDLARLTDMLGRMQRTLEVPEAGLLDNGNPFSRAWRDISRRCLDQAPPGVYRRWVQGHRAHFSNVIWHQSCVVSRTVPSLNEYVSFRGSTVGTAPCAAMVELTRGCEVPGQEMDLPALRALHEAWAFIHGCDNDMVSYGKELWDARRTPDAGSTCPTPLNIVGLVMRHQRCTLTEALDQVVTLRNQAMALLLHLIGRIRPHASSELGRYLVGVGPNIRGALDWYLCPRTQRYTNPDGKSPGAVEYTLPITDAAPSGWTTPPPLPTISWWWNHLD